MSSSYYKMSPTGPTQYCDSHTQGGCCITTKPLWFCNDGLACASPMVGNLPKEISQLVKDMFGLLGLFGSDYNGLLTNQMTLPLRTSYFIRKQSLSR